MFSSSMTSATKRPASLPFGELDVLLQLGSITETPNTAAASIGNFLKAEFTETPTGENYNSLSTSNAPCRIPLTPRTTLETPPLGREVSEEWALSHVQTGENLDNGFNSACNTPRDALSVKIPFENSDLLRSLAELSPLPIPTTALPIPTTTPCIATVPTTATSLKTSFREQFDTFGSQSTSVDFDSSVALLLRIRQEDPTFMQCLCSTSPCDHNTKTYKDTSKNRVVEASSILVPPSIVESGKSWKPQIHIQKCLKSFCDNGACKKHYKNITVWLHFLQIAGGCIYTQKKSNSNKKQLTLEKLIAAKKGLICLGMDSNFYYEWSGNLVAKFTEHLGGREQTMRATRLFFSADVSQEASTLLSAAYSNPPSSASAFGKMQVTMPSHTTVRDTQMSDSNASSNASSMESQQQHHHHHQQQQQHHRAQLHHRPLPRRRHRALRRARRGARVALVPQPGRGRPQPVLHVPGAVARFMAALRARGVSVLFP